ncbi:MAG TPA: class I SAM-dependent methyltransferase [Magnetospirillum sp.]|nr:class I SAM-dependent methyltransferase [Magnetospirillum sp.]
MTSQQKDLVRTLFSQEAARWTDWAYDPDESFDVYPTGKARLAIIRKELARMKPGRALRLIDAGCGSGDISLALEGDGHEVYGLDFAPNMIDICRQRFAQTYSDRGKADERFRVADVEDFTLPGRFDGGFAVGLLEYLERDQPFLAAMGKHMAPGGLLMVECRNRLFNAVSGNRFTVGEADAGELQGLTVELADVARFSPRPESDIPALMAEASARMASTQPFAADATQPSDPGIQFPSGVTRRMFTPAEMERIAAEAGFSLRHVIYYHLHILPTRFEKPFPRYYNALSMAAQPLGETPAGAYLGTCFLSVLEKLPD